MSRKNFSIKEIEQINASYAKLKQLDSEILTLEKTAMGLVEGDKKINLTLNVTDLLKKDESPAIDTATSMIRPYMPRMFYLEERELNVPNEVKYSSTEIKEEINDVFAIELVSFLLNIKNKIRNSIIANLASQGVEI